MRDCSPVTCATEGADDGQIRMSSGGCRVRP